MIKARVDNAACAHSGCALSVNENVFCRSGFGGGPEGRGWIFFFFFGWILSKCSCFLLVSLTLPAPALRWRKRWVENRHVSVMQPCTIFFAEHRRWLRVNRGKVEGKQNLTHFQLYHPGAMMETLCWTLEMFFLYFVTTITLQVWTNNYWHIVF